MNVLHLSYSNAAGVPFAWSKEDHNHGHNALCVTTGKPFGRVDRVAKDWTELLDWPDIVVVYDSADYAERVRLRGIPCVFHALGTAAVAEIDRVRKLSDIGVPLSATNLEFGRLGLPWIGMPIHARDYLPFRRPQDTFTACHAPTSRSYKGTAAVLRAFTATDIPLALIEGSKHEAALARKGSCHVLVDQILDEYNPDPVRLAGYGVNGLEAVAIGIPVLGQAIGQVKADILALDAQPLIFCDEDTLAATGELLRDDVKAYRAQVREGFDYLRRYHDPAAQAAQMHVLYREALAA